MILCCYCSFLHYSLQKGLCKVSNFHSFLRAPHLTPFCLLKDIHHSLQVKLRGTLIPILIITQSFYKEEIMICWHSSNNNSAHKSCFAQRAGPTQTHLSCCQLFASQCLMLPSTSVFLKNIKIFNHVLKKEMIGTAL